MVAISVDSPAESTTLAEKLGTRYPLLSDADLHVALAYGVAMKGRDIAVPSVFVVRPDRTIAWTKVGESVTDRPTPDAVLAQVRAATAERR
jgi:peroxiredoxin